MIGFISKAAFFLLLCSVAGSEIQAARDVPKDKVGVIVGVSGEVTIRGRKGTRRAYEGLELQIGDTLVVEKPGSKCCGLTPDAVRFELEDKGVIVFKRSEPRNPLAAWIFRQVSQWLGESRYYPLISRTAEGWKHVTHAPLPLIPAHKGQVRSSRQQFLWTLIDGIDRYELTITPEKGSEIKKIVRGYRAVLDELTPGATYEWRVRPKVDGWLAGSRPSNFRVMTSEEEKSLNTSLEDMPDLEAGVLLLSVGLYREAIVRFDAAASSSAYRESSMYWRAQALATIGLYREAYEDLMKRFER